MQLGCLVLPADCWQQHDTVGRSSGFRLSWPESCLVILWLHKPKCQVANRLEKMMPAGTKKTAIQEGDIPSLAKDAVQKAYRRALKSGSSVLEVVDGQLVRSNPDGSSTTLKTLRPGRLVTPGTKISLRK